VHPVQTQRSDHLVPHAPAAQLVIEVNGVLVHESAARGHALHQVRRRIDRLARYLQWSSVQVPRKLGAVRALLGRAAGLPVAERDAGRARRRRGDERPGTRPERVS
jgi:hypothetical protein